MGDTRQAPQGAETRPDGPPPGTRVIVDVHADGQPSAVSFSHEWRFEDSSTKRRGRIEIPAKKHGQEGTPIQFILHNGTQPRVELRFVDNDNAIWSSRTSCPEHDAHWDPELVDISPSGQVLNVMDLNRDECILKFNLRFVPDPRRYYYDPEIRNGGTT